MSAKNADAAPYQAVSYYCVCRYNLHFSPQNSENSNTNNKGGLKADS